MNTALIVVHSVIAVILIITVLLQSAKQEGITGSISGSGETFFGRNKGRTVDAMLSKLTSIVAALFIVTSIWLFINAIPKSAEDAANAITLPAEIPMDAEGNVIDINSINTSEQPIDLGESTQPDNSGVQSDGDVIEISPENFEQVTEVEDMINGIPPATEGNPSGNAGE